jgi:hypothetical protein
VLRVSKVPPGDPNTELNVGENRFECLTCPYQFVINKRYFERKYMKKKEVEDILGGKGAWDNVDKTQGTLHTSCDEMLLYGWLLILSQYNVRTRSAETTKRIGISCRFVVLTSL